ncbi:hypothetical protein ACFFRR_005844 [Megaselia abdita]
MKFKYLKYTWLILVFVKGTLAISTGSNKTQHQSSFIDESSQEDEIFATSYVLPKQIYNDGIPYYVEKDAISGQFDFSSKKPAGIEPSVNEVFDPKEKIVLSSAAPNIHDILHLPVKYSSSKFVYPLVSSSYANLKYQGNNKNYVSNNKEYPQRANITKLLAQPNFSNLKSTTTSAPTSSAITSTTARSTTTTRPTTSTKKTTTPTTRVPETTVAKGPTIKPFVFETTTEKRKSIPTKKYHPASSTTTQSTYGMKTSPKNPVMFTTTTSRPTQKTTSNISFKQLQTSTQISILDPADVYNAMATEQVKILNNNELNSISLTGNDNPEIDSELESYIAQQENQGLDVHGNLMQPIQPSKPSPFSFKKIGYTQTIPQPNGQAYQQGKPIEEQEYFNPRPQSLEPQISGNEYVSLHIPKPSMPVPVKSNGINNVIISPGQNSASFVLGSHQQTNNRLSNDKNGHGHPIQYGQVINEDISTIPRPQMIIQGSPNSLVQGHVLPDTVIDLPNHSNLIGDQETKDVLVTTNFRFPDEQGLEQTKASENINGHAQPLSLHQLKQTKPSVVFPSNEKEISQSYAETDFKPPNKVFFDNEKDQMVQQHEVLPLNQYNNMQQTKLKFPDLSEGLTPPQEQPTSDPRPSDLNNRQGSVRPPPPGFKFVDIRKQQLPNILPQFRPNAKIGSGPPPFKDRINSYKGNFPNRMLPPQFQAQRRTPLYRYAANQPQQEANRRIFRGPANGQNQFDNRQVFFRRSQLKQTSVKPQHPPAYPPPPAFQGATHSFPGMIMQPYTNSDRFTVERNSKHSLPTAEISPPETILGSDRLAAFEEEDIMVNDPPKPTTISKKSDEPELEPVVTLQMLKTKKLVPGDISEAASIETPKFDYEVIGPTQGLYVVYPHKTGNVKFQPEEIQVSSEHKQSEPAIVNFEASSQGSDYQNTPFSVVRDTKQEPILMAKPQKPLHQKSHEEFPYRLEKPSIQELGQVHEIDRNDNFGAFVEKVAIADTPIAIAYSPTESNPYRSLAKFSNNQPQTQFSNPNSASQVIPEIRDENEYESDSRGQNYEKDFQAPFYPSMSLNSATPSGWSYEVTGSNLDQKLDLYKKNNVNRADADIVINEKKTLSTTESNKLSENSDDSFSPQLQGGFKPIYPPGYKEEVEDNGSIARVEITPPPETTTVTDKIMASSTQDTLLATTTSEKPKHDRKKKEPSLADILFGVVDEDEELGEIES